jgi:hypothetical protein
MRALCLQPLSAVRKAEALGKEGEMHLALKSSGQPAGEAHTAVCDLQGL